MCNQVASEIHGKVVRGINPESDGDNVRVIPERVFDREGEELPLKETLESLYERWKPGKYLNVRLANVDAPEITTQIYRRDGREIRFAGQGKYGRLAQEKLIELLGADAEVILEFDLQKAGSHGRPLGHVWTVANGRKDQLVNELMIRSGLVLPYIIAPSVRYAGRIRTAAAQAQAAGEGIYSKLIYDRLIVDPAVLNEGEELNEPFVYRRLLPYLICSRNRCPTDSEIDPSSVRWLGDITTHCYYPYEAYQHIPPHARTWFSRTTDMESQGFRLGQVTRDGLLSCGSTRRAELSYTPFGAAGQVTGSKHLFERSSPDKHFGLLVDCGLNHEQPTSDEVLAQIAARTDAVVITHAHLDHFGDLPRLLEFKPSLPIHCSYGTYRVMTETSKRKVNGVYKSTFKRFENNFQIHAFGRPFTIGEQVSAQLWNAGHMPGSAQLTLAFRLSSGQKRVVHLSGDLGPYHDIPLLQSPETELPVKPDLLLCEATYGTADRSPDHNSARDLIDVVNYARGANKKVICAAFSVMRTQAILFDFWRLKRQGLLPPGYRVVLKASEHASAVKLNRYLGSWLTGQFRPPADLAGYSIEPYDPATAWELQGENPFTPFECSNYSEADRADFIIVSDGMWNYGNANRALRNHAGDEQYLFLLAGFQAEGSNGRQLQNAMEARPDGSPNAAQEIAVKQWDWDGNISATRTLRLRAEVQKLRAYQSHVDGPGRQAYVQKIQPQRLMLIHGDEDALTAVAAELQALLADRSIEIPRPGESYAI